MTPTTKPVTRVSQNEHPRHKRKIVITVGPGDTVALRLQRSSKVGHLSIESLYDLAERKRAEAITGFNAGPCANPRRVRNV